MTALGEFDLDPCANRLWPLANRTWYKTGFTRPWFGRVWLNPPYGKELADWMFKLSVHGNGVALVFARTETAWFHKCVWDQATALLFFKGRLKFANCYGAIGKQAAPAPSVLVAYGEANAQALVDSGLDGKVVTL